MCPSEARKRAPNGTLMPLLDYFNISYCSASQLQHSLILGGMEMAWIGFMLRRGKMSAIRIFPVKDYVHL